jgi:hypothetical protein
MLDDYEDDFNIYTDDLGRRYVEHRRLCCPVCKSLKTVAKCGKKANGDGPATRPYIYKTYACRFMVVPT